MCTTNELRSLIRELLHHIEQVALLSAKIQFKDENKQQKPNEYITCCEKTNNYRNNSILNTRFNQLFRFHSAYMKYFVFALDPYAEVIVPLTSSPLTLFITNILAKVSPQRQTASTHQTSKSIIEFLQVCWLTMRAHQCKISFVVQLKKNYRYSFVFVSSQNRCTHILFVFVFPL